MFLFVLFLSYVMKELFIKVHMRNLEISVPWHFHVYESPVGNVCVGNDRVVVVRRWRLNGKWINFETRHSGFTDCFVE